MMIAVQGTGSFNNYNAFMRSMAVAMSGKQEEDAEILVYSFGPKTVNDFVAGFCNITERSLKSRGIKIRYRKMPVSTAEEVFENLDYFIFLSNPGEYVSKLAKEAELRNIEVGIFRY